jgi:CheY-like chemotaxis protein
MYDEAIEHTARQSRCAALLLKRAGANNDSPCPGRAERMEPMNAIPAHILLVDDDPGITEHLSHILEKADFVVTVATDGEEALELIRSLRPDLVLLDIDLPKLDGRLVLLRVRGDKDQTPIILLTKYSDIARKHFLFDSRRSRLGSLHASDDKLSLCALHSHYPATRNDDLLLWKAGTDYHCA